MNDKTITIYNYNKDGRVEEWKRTVISGVEYSYKHEKTVSSSGAIVLSELLTIVIPAEADTCGKRYVDYIDYLKLEDVSDYWTINPSCNKEVVVCGECNDNISSEYTITDLKKNHMKSGIIAGFSDNTEGLLLKHYKVVCK